MFDIEEEKPCGTSFTRDPNRHADSKEANIAMTKPLDYAKNHPIDGSNKDPKRQPTMDIYGFFPKKKKTN